MGRFYLSNQNLLARKLTFSLFLEENICCVILREMGQAGQVGHGISTALPLSVERQYNFEIVTSPESVSVPLKIIIYKPV